MSWATRSKDQYRYVEPPRFRRTVPLTLVGVMVAGLFVVGQAFAVKPPPGGTPIDATTTTTMAHDLPEATLAEAGWNDASFLRNYSPGKHPGSMFWITKRVTGASDFWADGFIGSGIDVALIDSGVVPVDGLRYPGKVINGADLSFESQADNLRYLDTYGHGTHLAGIIAGRSDDADSISGGNSSSFLGMAPGARIVSRWRTLMGRLTSPRSSPPSTGSWIISTTTG